ncbi:MAG: hypothetical protein AB7R69_01780 [Candidatus Babeliales bacterium]
MKSCKMFLFLSFFLFFSSGLSAGSKDPLYDELCSVVLDFGDYCVEQNILGDQHPAIINAYCFLANGNHVDEEMLLIAVRALMGNRALQPLVPNIFEKLCSLLLGFNYTVTALQELNDVLEEKFEETFTIVNALIKSFTTFAAGQAALIFEQDFSEVFTALEELNATLCSKFMETWTILGCQPMPISAPTTITQPGSYCLINDISGQITIAADNVLLDLAGRTIQNTPTAIVVMNQANIIIKNGILSSNSTIGIDLIDSQTISIQEIDFIDSSTGINASNVSCLNVYDCTFRSSGRGLNFNNVVNAHVALCKLFFILTHNGPLFSFNNGENITVHDIYMNNSAILSTAPMFMSATNQGSFVVKKCRCITNFVFVGGISTYFFIDGESAVFEDCDIIDNTSLLFKCDFRSSSCLVKNVTFSRERLESTSLQSGSGMLTFAGESNFIVKNSVFLRSSSPFGSISPTAIYVEGDARGVLEENIIQVPNALVASGIIFSTTNSSSCLAKNNIMRFVSTIPFGAFGTAIGTSSGTPVAWGNLAQSQFVKFNFVTPSVTYVPSTGTFTAGGTTSGRDLDNVEAN